MSGLRPANPSGAQPAASAGLPSGIPSGSVEPGRRFAGKLHRRYPLFTLAVVLFVLVLALLERQGWSRGWIGGSFLIGTVLDELEISGVALRHEPSHAATRPEIAGHLHPAAKVRMRGRALRRRCFVLSATRCVMPAMGAYAGGLNLRDAAFRPLFRTGLSAHLLGDGRLFRIDPRLLLPD